MADFNRRLTGNSACTTVMQSLGLTPPPSFAGTTHKTAAQFWTLATEVGQQLMDLHPWEVLNQTFTITTAVGVSSYALPADFNGFVDDAGWNQTTTMPTIGSLEEFEWQAVKAQTGLSTQSMLYRLADDQVQLAVIPTAVQTIVMAYRGRGWVLAADNVTYKDNIAANDDSILLDPTLFKTALKRAWMDAKQFDTSRIDREYMRALAFAKAKDKPGRTLSLASNSSYPFLGGLNIPDTGYGI